MFYYGVDLFVWSLTPHSRSGLPQDALLLRFQRFLQEAALAQGSEGAAVEAALTSFFHSLLEYMCSLPSSKALAATGTTGK